MSKIKIILFSTIIISYTLMMVCILIAALRLPSEYKLSFDLIGKVPLCNRRADSAPHIGNFVFIFCWRCTGMISSFFTTVGIFFIPCIRKKILATKSLIIYLIIFVLVVPLIVDGVRQYFFMIPSNNLFLLLS